VPCQAQPNNAANIMMKNLLDLCIGVLAFYIFGYTIAFGETEDVGIADAGHAVGVSVVMLGSWNLNDLRRWF